MMAMPWPLPGDAVDELGHCNKCGFCLPACPTYDATGSEVHSPRGRLSLVEAAWRGEIEPGQGLADALSACLGCLACETACPSGVRYGRVLEAARASLARTTRRYVVTSSTAGVMLKLVRRRRWLRWAVTAGRLARRLPTPRGLEPLMALLPPSEPDAAPARTASDTLGTVSVWYFTSCVMDTVFPQANRDAEMLLEAAGARVEAPTPQDCCGALHLHSGDVETARDLARANLKRWAALPPDTLIVSHAGGCAAMIHEYGHLLADDPVWSDQALHWAKQVRDFSTALLGLPQALEFRGDGSRVGLQNSCHVVNSLHQGTAPVQLLQSVDGDVFVPLDGQNRCCGSAGLYNLLQPELAGRILDRHLAEVREAALDLWVTNNPGCALQCQSGVRTNGLATRATHLATHLAQRWTGRRQSRVSE